jgi:hypothetical protein
MYKDPSGMPGQYCQQVEFGSTEVYRPPADCHPPALEVDRNVACHHWCWCLLPFRACAPEHGPHAGDQFAGTEGLGHIIVRAELQPDEPICLVHPGGEHDERDVTVPAQGASDVQAVNAWQPKINDDEGWFLVAEQG